MDNYLSYMEIEIIPVVNAVIVINGKFLLGKRDSNKNFLPGYWTIPGGKVEAGEKLKAALKREVKEETFLDMKKYSLLRIGEQFHDNHHHIVFDFLVKPKDDNFKKGSDLVELSLFNKSQLDGLKMDLDSKKFLENIDLKNENKIILNI